MTPIEAAYVGATIDGEGDLTFYPHGMKGRWPRYRLGVGNQRLEIISALLRATGVGQVYHDTPHNPLYRKEMWRWQVLGVNDVLSIAQQTLSYSEKAQDFLRSVGDYCVNGEVYTGFSIDDGTQTDDNGSVE